MKYESRACLQLFSTKICKRHACLRLGGVDDSSRPPKLDVISIPLVVRMSLHSSANLALRNSDNFMKPQKAHHLHAESTHLCNRSNNTDFRPITNFESHKFLCFWYFTFTIVEPFEEVIVFHVRKGPNTIRNKKNVAANPTYQTIKSQVHHHRSAQQSTKYYGPACSFRTSACLHLNHQYQALAAVPQLLEKKHMIYTRGSSGLNK